MRVSTLPERFWAKVDKRAADDCWPWLAYVTKDGYGRISRTGQGNGMALAHRAAYELVIGPIPGKLEVDHTCHDSAQCAGGVDCPHRACCNPAHLRLATIRENLLRGATVAAKHLATTHCPQGHPYAGENLRVDKNGHRSCWTCRRARRARHA